MIPTLAEIIAGIENFFAEASPDVGPKVPAHQYLATVLLDLRLVAGRTPESAFVSGYALGKQDAVRICSAHLQLGHYLTDELFRMVGLEPQEESS